MFKIVDVASDNDVGSVGFWTKEWGDEQIYEVGWMVVPEFQGRGIAVAGTVQAIELASARPSIASCTPSRTSTMRRQTRSAASSALSCSTRVRVRVPEGAFHDMQRLAPGPARLVRATTVALPQNSWINRRGAWWRVVGGFGLRGQRVWSHNPNGHCEGCGRTRRGHLARDCAFRRLRVGFGAGKGFECRGGVRSTALRFSVRLRMKPPAPRGWHTRVSCTVTRVP